MKHCRDQKKFPIWIKADLLQNMQQILLEMHAKLYYGK